MMCLNTYAHLTVCSVTDLLHQLYGIFRTRLDNTFERVGNPGMVPQDGQCQLQYQSIDGFRKTYRRVTLSNSGLNIRGLPSSSNTGPMSNTDSTQATTRYTVWRAKSLPGQILPGLTGSIIHDRGRCKVVSLTSFRRRKSYLQD